MSTLKLVFLSIAISFAIVVTDAGNQIKNISYDGRSLLINGRRDLFFSGSVHYPRSTPEMWPDILDKARKGGLNVIQTYVFWNIHEPEQGKFTMEGNYDLVKFMKLIQEKGMYATLRVGPFIQAEWNHGGLPYWLKDVPNIIFRTVNEPFKKHMKEYVTTVIQKMTEAKLFAPQGGPIILAQIENEYDHVKLAYDEDGHTYVQWAAELAVSQNVGVPWVMCKQTDAPDPVINACNGRHCGDTFSGPNKPYKPSIWTENWTAQYRVFGDPPTQRSAEDIAFSVARFFAKNGNLVNYYMYHGGTNFGRTSAAFTTTRYYDQAPLDEFGLQRDPKWSHLRDVHRALNLCKKPLLTGVPSTTRLSEFHEIIVYENPGSHLCAAFLTNNNSQAAATINFRGKDHYLPPHSISILPDCKTVVFNTESIASQHNARTFKKSDVANNHKWEIYIENIPTVKELPPSQKAPSEVYTLLKDKSDYAWFTTSVELGQQDVPTQHQPWLHIGSLGHSQLVFVNGEFVGSKHGSHEEKSFDFQKSVTLKVGVNHITILACTVGLPDSGAYMEHRFAGPSEIKIIGLNSGTMDITRSGWGQQVALNSEKLGIFTEEGSKKVNWKEVKGTGPSLSWYKTRFATPEGKSPVAIRMDGMGKGLIWINGKCIGRHWMNFLDKFGNPTQPEYHIPRTYLNPKDNLLVVLEEDPASPEKISILRVDRDTICSHITEHHPPNVKLFASKQRKFQTVVENPVPQAILKCENRKTIQAVEFASFGDPEGYCGIFKMGKCDAPATKQIVEQYCLRKNSCSIPMDKQLFTKGQDGCPGVMKSLAIQVRCH
ncbi:hypothetical protein RJT34_31801 [Clitoria ternatea]|uniref:Beta-galactosidase n=1 Tax=Clitoria ternatea TaxID=43366 RepID=A0AAN9EX28_CLITE